MFACTLPAATLDTPPPFVLGCIPSLMPTPSKKKKPAPAVSRSPSKGQKLDTTPRLRVFKFSTRNKTDAAYRDRQKVLSEKFGVPFTFRKNAKLTGQRKAAITRRLTKYAEFLNPENQFKFVPLTPATLRKVSHLREISSAQRTRGGVFVPVPKSGKRAKTSVKVDRKTGKISVRTGKFKSTFKKYRSVDVVKNPEKIIADAKKRGAESIFVSIKGHRGGSLKYGYSLKSFLHYLTNETNGLLQDVEEGIEEPEEYKRKKGKASVFKNWFAVEFVSHEWKKTSSTKTKFKKRK